MKTVGEHGLEGTQDAYGDEVFDNKYDITPGETTTGAYIRRPGAYTGGCH